MFCGVNTSSGFPAAKILPFFSIKILSEILHAWVRSCIVIIVVSTFDTKQAFGLRNLAYLKESKILYTIPPNAIAKTISKIVMSSALFQPISFIKAAIVDTHGM